MHVKLAILGLLLLISSAHAETFLTVPLISYHFNDSADHCEANFGLGMETDVARGVRFHAGGFQNSNCRPSTYVAMSQQLLAYKRWQLGLALGGFTGYHKEKKVNGETQYRDKIILAPLLAIAYEKKTWGFNIIGVPPKDDFRGSVGIVWKKPF